MVRQSRLLAALIHFSVEHGLRSFSVQSTQSFLAHSRYSREFEHHAARAARMAIGSSIGNLILDFVPVTNAAAP